MTDLIPRDAAIAAVYHADSFELSLCGTSRIEQRIELIPTIDPAAIREAALREAAELILQVKGRRFTKDMSEMCEIIHRRIIAIIGEKK